MNSLADPAAKTKIENGVVYSEREMFIDSLHDDRHDILLANIGIEERNTVYATKSGEFVFFLY